MDKLHLSDAKGGFRFKYNIFFVFLQNLYIACKSNNVADAKYYFHIS